MEIPRLERQIAIDVLNDLGFNWQLPVRQEYQPDWSQLEYQNIYKKREFIESKFTGHWEHIPGFDKIITKMSEKITSPLKEINERYYIANEIRNSPDFFEFKDSR